jgi:hypothetical protein
MIQGWEKIDWFDAARFRHGLSVSHAAIPFALPRADETHRVYFAARDATSRSRTFFFDTDLRTVPRRTVFHGEVALDIGELGAFDDSGAMPSWVLEKDGRSWLYYTGWSLGRTVPFYFYIGLAIGDAPADRFTRVSRAPILGRNPHDPLLTASPCVLFEDGRFHMWYVSAVRWESTAGDEPRHYYNIRYADSADGVSWRPLGTAIDFASAQEYAFGRPCVVPTEDGYLMWYSVRGDAYRLGLAVSNDRRTWTRVDDRVGIRGGLTGQDDEMIGYAQVFPAHGRWWMVYNGNGYGRTGIGLAACHRLPLVKDLLGD